MKASNIFFLCAMALLSGCFVCSETRFPDVKSTALPQGRDMHVQLSGFEATVTTYATVAEAMAFLNLNFECGNDGEYCRG